MGGWGECKVYSHIKLITVLPEEMVRLVCVRVCVWGWDGGGGTVGVGGWRECKVYSHIKLITVLPEKVRLVCVCGGGGEVCGGGVQSLIPH